MPGSVLFNWRLGQTDERADAIPAGINRVNIDVRLPIVGGPNVACPVNDYDRYSQ